jgi:hypothetical protein
MNAAAAYVDHGWSICSIPAGEKGPKGSSALGWNTPEKAHASAEDVAGWTGNVGLLHAWSRTCALDIDDYVKAREWLLERSIDLDALLAADDAVQICSGRQGRAKLLFALPEGVDPQSLHTVQIIDPAATGARRDAMWLELRCSASGGVTVQDVLPPSIHPDTGKPYTWGGAGDWRSLPTAPSTLLTLWLDHVEPEKGRSRQAPTGPGTSAAVIEFVDRLDQAGCKPYRSGRSFRAHCPNHGGVSGTTLKIDERADGDVLSDCKAGCTWQQILAAMPPRNREVVPVGLVEQLKIASDARKAAANEPVSHALPAFPAELLALPHGLGYLQQWILGYMTHPSPATAGMCALATLAHFSMAHLKIDSRDGLGLNEQYLVLAPTGFGKEDLRKPFPKITASLETMQAPPGRNLWLSQLPKLQYSAPASQQGLHRLLEEHSAQTFLADEFAEWLSHAASDSHKQQALGHVMQAYSKAFGTLAAPAVASKENGYTAVENPRVLIFATSTPERILETINASQADSGALNRFLIFVSEQDRIPKRYDVTAKNYEPPQGVIDLVAWIIGLPDDTVIGLSEDARAYYVAHDSAVIDPLGFKDPRLAKRLGEQAFKIAALIALSDRRVTIEERDLAIAYAIREGLYHRAASLIGHDGAISGMHPTGRAIEQIRQRLETSPFVYRSQLPKLSRQFAKLSVSEQQAVVQSLQHQGFARVEGGKLVSLLIDHAAAA